MVDDADVTEMETSVFGGGGGGADVPPPEHPVSRMTLSRTIPKVPKTKARPIRIRINGFVLAYRDLGKSQSCSNLRTPRRLHLQMTVHLRRNLSPCRPRPCLAVR